MHWAQTLRARLITGRRKASLFVQLPLLGILDALRNQVKLDFRLIKPGPGFQKLDQCRLGQAQKAAATDRITQYLPNLAKAAHPFVIGNTGSDDLPLDTCIDMIPKILTIAKLSTPSGFIT